MTWSVQGNEPELFDAACAPAPGALARQLQRSGASSSNLPDRHPASRSRTLRPALPPALAAAHQSRSPATSRPIRTSRRRQRWPRLCDATSTRCTPSSASARSAASGIRISSPGSSRTITSSSLPRRSSRAVSRTWLVDPHARRSARIGMATRCRLRRASSQDEAPSEDRLEEFWRSYYASIFNPARLKVKAMQAEMPKKYWRNLPEASLIEASDRRRRTRDRAMIAAEATEPHKPPEAGTSRSMHARHAASDEPRRAARGRRRLPRLPALERRDADRVRRRPGPCADHAGRRAARRQGRPRRQTVRGTGGPDARPRAEGSRHRSRRRSTSPTR